MKTRLHLTFLISSSALLIMGAQLFGQVHVWVGNSLTTSNWDDTANWQDGTNPQNGDPLVFQGSNRTTNTNNLGNADYTSITFNSGAAAFTLQGNTIGVLAAGITNNSANTQTINFTLQNATIPAYNGLAIYESQTWSATAGPLNVFSNVQAAPSPLIGGEVTVTVVGPFTTTITGSMADDPTDPANTLAVTKAGPGTVILSGMSTYTGETHVLGGGLQLDGSITSDTIVHSGGTLSGTGLVVGDVVNSGIVSPGTSAGTLRVTSDYTQNSQGTLRIEIGRLGATQHDLLTVGGSNGASLDGTLQLLRLNNFQPMAGDRVTIIDADGGNSGQFSTVTDNFPGLVRPIVIYETFNVVVEFVQGSFNIGGLTPNQEAVAKNLDDVANDPAAAPLITFLGNEPLGNLPRDYDLIAPEELAAIYEIGFAQAVVHSNNLQRRMDDIRAGVNGFCPEVSTPQVSGKDYSKDGKASLTDTNTTVVPAPENRWGTFVTGSGNFVNVGEEDFNAHGYDITTGHFTLGADYRVGEHFAVGIDGGYSASTADLVNAGRIEVDGGQVGVYATVFGHGLFGSKSHVDAAVSGGWNSYDTRRTGLQDLPVRGSTNGSEFNSFISYGADWTFGCLNLGTWSSLQYTNVSIDSFTEDGSLAPLQIQDQDEDSVRATTGVRASYDIKAGHAIIRPEIRAAYLHEYNNRSYPIDASLASGAGSIFRVRGPEIGRNAALVGAGVNVQWCPRFSTYVYYDGVLGRENYSNNAVSAGAHVSF